MNYIKFLLPDSKTISGAMSYIKSRLKEISTLDGATLIAVGVGYLMFNSIAVYLAYAAIAYGAYRILKPDA